MAPNTAHLLVFGDQVIDKRPMIRRLVRNAKSSQAARQFLREATDLVQIGLAKVLPAEHGWPGSIESLLDVAEEHATREMNDTALFYITSVMALIGRLGDLIVRAEDDPSILGARERPTHVLALCAGQIPAVAAVAATDTSELFVFAREILEVGFRWMHAVYLCRQAMISPAQVGGWSVTFPGLRVRQTQTILDDFHSSQGIPALHKIAIGVVSRSWITLVGPASTFARLYEYSPVIRDAPRTASDAGVPAHGPFMNNVDYDKVVGRSPLLDRPLDWSKVVMVSPSGACRPRKFRTVRELLKDVLDDILMRVLLVDETVESSISQIDLNISVNVHQVGETSHMPLVLQTLTGAGLSYDVTPMPTSTSRRCIGSRGMSDRVAVIGFSYRSTDGDKSWVSEAATGATKTDNDASKSEFDGDTFDSEFFQMSQSEATNLSSAERLSLIATHEALEMAGYAPGATLSTRPERIASFLADSHNPRHREFAPGSTEPAARSSPDVMISHFFGFERTSYICPISSLVAVHMACKSLIWRDCDMAVAGGVSSQPHLEAQSGEQTKRHGDISVIVLKRLEEAVADKDDILGVISASSQAYSPMHNVERKSREKVLRELAVQAAIDPEDIAYIHISETSTRTGILEGVHAGLSAIGSRRDTDKPLIIGCERDSHGVAALINGLQILRGQDRPTQFPISFEDIRKEISKLRNVKFASPDLSFPSRSNATDRKAAMIVTTSDTPGSMHGFMLEEIPTLDPRDRTQLQDIGTAHVIAISAKTEYSLRQNLENLLVYLEQHPTTRLSDLEYTTTARRTHGPLRKAFISNSIDDLTTQMRHAKTEIIETPRPCQCSFVFQGPTDDCIKLGKDLYRTSQRFREMVDTYQLTASNHGLPQFLPIITGTTTISVASKAQMHLATAATQLGVAFLLRSWGIKPHCIVGTDVGEYAALCVSGILSPSDVLYLVGHRAMILKRHSPASEEAKNEFEHVARHVSFRSPEVPIVTSSKLQLIKPGSVLALDDLTRQMRDGGDLVDALRVACEQHDILDNKALWINVGVNGAPLDGLPDGLGIDPRYVLSISSPEKPGKEVMALIVKEAYQHSLPVDWKFYHAEHLDSVSLLSDLPSYAWDNMANRAREMPIDTPTQPILEYKAEETTSLDSSTNSTADDSIVDQTDSPISLASDTTADRTPSPTDACINLIAGELGLSPTDLTDEKTFADLKMDSRTAITVLFAIKKQTGLDLPPTFFLSNYTVALAKQAISNASEDLISDTKEEPAPTLTDICVGIISGELGLSTSDFTEEKTFADLKMDSRTAITVLFAIRKQTGLDLPPTFFLSNFTVRLAKQAIASASEDQAREA